MTDISRQCTAYIQHLTYGNTTFHDKTVVQANQSFYPGTDHQIITDGYLCHTITYIIQHDIQEGSIQYNIPMIGNKRTRLFILRQTASSGDRQRKSCLVSHHHHCLISQLRFKIFFRLERTHCFGKLFPVYIRFDVPEGPLEIFVGYQCLDCILHLVVVQRTNVVKIIGNFCIHIV